MDSYFFRQLSEVARGLVEEIECLVYKPLGVVQRKDNLRYGCRQIDQGWEILAPRLDRLKDGPMIHELLHIHRVVVDGVPSVIPSVDRLGDHRFSDFLSDVENSIEHIYIVPREISLWPDRRGIWGKNLHAALRSLKRSGSIGRYEKVCIVLWWSLVKVAVPSNNLIRSWKYFFDENDLLDFAEYSSEKILQLSSKELVINILLDIAEIDRADVEID